MLRLYLPVRWQAGQLEHRRLRSEQAGRQTWLSLCTIWLFCRWLLTQRSRRSVQRVSRVSPVLHLRLLVPLCLKLPLLLIASLSAALIVQPLEAGVYTHNRDSIQHLPEDCKQTRHRSDRRTISLCDTCTLCNTTFGTCRFSIVFVNSLTNGLVTPADTKRKDSHSFRRS